MAVATTKRLRLKSATKKWDEMSKRERAVALAKDVILLVKAKRAKPERGTYLFVDKIKAADLGDDARKAIGDKKCTVCAKGALLLAKVTARNSLSLDDIGGYKRDYAKNFEVEAGDYQCTNNVADAMNWNMCGRLEKAFEQSNWHSEWARWGHKYPSDKDRLIAIMQRVIDNGGTFSEDDLNNA